MNAMCYIIVLSKYGNKPNNHVMLGKDYTVIICCLYIKLNFNYYTRTLDNSYVLSIN